MNVQRRRWTGKCTGDLDCASESLKIFEQVQRMRASGGRLPGSLL